MKHRLQNSAALEGADNQKHHERGDDDQESQEDEDDLPARRMS